VIQRAALKTHPQKIFLSLFDMKTKKMTVRRSKYLIYMNFLALNFQSIYQIDRMMRHPRGWTEAYPQSYPQFVWMDG
jgi:hypothetical protein